MQRQKGIFIAIEGIDGSGKGTQYALLRQRLEQAGYEVACFDFPQYNETSSYFIKQYLNGQYGSLDEVGPYTASLFYALDRFQAGRAIQDALAAGKIVLANRFAGSNMAHQGSKIRHPEERRGFFIWLDNLEFCMLNTPRPDINLVLRVPASTAQQLVDQKGERAYTDKKRDIHEANLEHLRITAEVYDDLCQLFPRDYMRIDCMRSRGLMDAEQVSGLVWSKVEPLLPAITHTPTEAPPQSSSVAQHDAAPEAEATVHTTTQPISIFQTLRGGVNGTHHDSSAPISPIQGKDRYFAPPEFDDTTRAVYISYMDKFLSMHADMTKKLARFLRDRTPSLDETAAHRQALASTQFVLPLSTHIATASFGTLPQEVDAPSAYAATNESLQQMADSYLTRHYVEADETVSLTSVWPRNELDVVADILYEFSDQPLEAIKNDVDAWSYDKKTQTLGSYMTSSTPVKPVLRKICYSWDFITDIATLHSFVNATDSLSIEWQKISPRLGFGLPAAIEEAGLSEPFEACFDLSVELSSLLHDAGYPEAIPYATLLGHRLRWSVTCNADDIFRLYEHYNIQRPECQRLLLEMMQRIAEVHPLIAQHQTSMASVNTTSTPESDGPSDTSSGSQKKSTPADSVTA